MKFLDEYRDQKLAEKLVQEIQRTVTRPWVLMEVCGGQTHSIVKYGLDQLLPNEIELVHGPGCPVCVTSLEMLAQSPRGPTSFSVPLATCSGCRAPKWICSFSNRKVRMCESSILRLIV
jgi:hydrogenase maturation factor